MRKRDVTIHDVAAQSGVSYQTVSRVINEMPDVADATRQRVTKVLDRLGYRPNLTARHLVSRRSTVIGVVTFATGLYGPSQIVLNVERAARANGYNIMFAGIPEENVEEIHRAVDTLCAHRVAGILMHLPLEIDLRLFATSAKLCLWWPSTPISVLKCLPFLFNRKKLRGC